MRISAELNFVIEKKKKNSMQKPMVQNIPYISNYISWSEDLSFDQNDIMPQSHATNSSRHFWFVLFLTASFVNVRSIH